MSTSTSDTSPNCETVRRPGRGWIIALAVSLAVTACVSEAEPGEMTIYGPYIGPEADIFGEVVASFEEETGITASYVGSGSFDVGFEDRINSGDLPDVTVLPQIALMETLVEDDYLTPLDHESSEQLIATVGEFWSALVAPEGEALAVPYRFVVKSLIWHRTDVFEEQGYEIPETLTEMTALTLRMIEDGFTPWCAGMDSETSTGWWATDWIEDLVIRRADSDAYWAWAFLQTPFTEDTVVEAMREFQDMITTEGAVDGGTRAILNVEVAEAIDPMFDEEPGCLMHKQASFQPVWLPEGVEFGDGRLDVFPLPGVEAGAPPMMISGEVVVATSDSPAATDFLRFLLTDVAFLPWLEAGGSLVARAEPSDEPSENELDQKIADMVADAPDVVIDASDIMPREIGTDVFFAAMIDLVAGRSPSLVAAEIQDAVDALPPRDP